MDTPPGSTNTLRWDEYNISKFCKAESIEDERICSTTFRQLLNYNDVELARLAAGDLSTQQYAKGYQFWADALVDDGPVFSLSRGRFVITPQHVEALPQEAQELLRELSEDNAENTASALGDLLDMLARSAVPSGRFGLPLLDLDRRAEALNDLAQLIQRLHLGRANGNGGTGRILLGPKGTGKSAFLQALAIATSLLCPKLTVVYINYASVVHDQSSPVSPAHMLHYADLCSRADAGALANLSHLPNPSDWQATYAKLQASTQRFLIIADEFNKVYSAKGLADIVAQFHLIGQATEGRVSAVLSGSSAALFNLCYGHIDPATQAKYPSYNGVSLNSGRYTDLRMQPARGREQFRRVLEHIQHAAQQGHKEHQFFSQGDLEKVDVALRDERRLMQLYALTGGKFRYLKEFFTASTDSTPGAYSTLISRIIRDFNEQWAADLHFEGVMRKLVELREGLRATARGTDSAADEAFWAEAWLDAKQLSAAGLSEYHAYELGDKNLLFVESTKAGLRVTFETGIQEDLCRARVSCVTLGAYECVCLRYPYGQLGIDAEDLVLKSLAANSSKLVGFEADLQHKEQRFCMLPCVVEKRATLLQHLGLKDIVVCGDKSALATKQPFRATIEKLQRIRTALPLNELLKEYPDTSGADAILFLPSTDAGSVRVLRFQIKLGQSIITKGCAKTIVDKLQKGDEQVRLVLAKIPEGKKPVIEHYLITTRELRQEARDHFDEQRVHVLGREEMYPVWLEQIREFDRSIGLGIYA